MLEEWLPHFEDEEDVLAAVIHKYTPSIFIPSLTKNWDSPYENEKKNIPMTPQWKASGYVFTTHRNTAAAWQ